MEQHDDQRDRRTDGCGETGPLNPHVKDKYEKIVSEYIYDSAREDAYSGKYWIIVVSEKSSKHLHKQKTWKDHLNGFQVFACQLG